MELVKMEGRSNQPSDSATVAARPRFDNDDGVGAENGADANSQPTELIDGDMDTEMKSRQDSKQRDLCIENCQSRQLRTRHSIESRDSVIVPNPGIVRSASTPCNLDTDGVATLSDPELCSTSTSLSSRWADSPDSIIDRLRFVNAEHLRVLCRSYITSLVNCPELEQILKDDDASSSASSRSAHRKSGRRTRTFSLSSNSKKGKPIAQSGAIFGNPLTQEGIAQITQLFDFLSRDENLKTEGLFRKSGNIARQKELKVLLDTGSDLNLSDGRSFSAHDCANVLKNFLGELPEPLLQEKYYGAHCQVPELSDSPVHPSFKQNTKKCTSLQLLFLLLPRESYLFLRSLLRFLSLVASHADSNRMTPLALGTLFAPHILCPRSMTPTEQLNAASLVSRSVEFMIENVEWLFGAPPELVQSAEMFLRRRTEGKAVEPSFGSPLNVTSDNLDSSTEGLLSPNGKRGKRHRRGSTGERHVNIFGFGSDTAQGAGKAGRGRHPSSPTITPAGPPDSPAPVDPILRFVDQKTSQAAEEGCTRKALQELYANIQSMPEGPKKKKYIKMLQKNHGLGAPIPSPEEAPEQGDSPPEEERRGRKHSRSRSFGEALGNIKRALSRNRHQRSRSSSRNRAAAGRLDAAGDAENKEDDAPGEGGVDAENKISPPERDESPPSKTHRGGPWVHRQHCKGATGTTLSPIAMSPMDHHHAHTPVIAASPVTRKHSSALASSLAGGNSSTPKISANAIRALPDRQSQRSSISSLRHGVSSTSSPLSAVRSASTASVASPNTRPLKSTANFSDKLLSLSEQSSKTTTSCGTPHGKTGTVLHRGPNANNLGMERFRSPLPSKFALSVAQSLDLVPDVVLADDEALV